VRKANDHERICVRVAALLAKERQRKGLSMTQLATDSGLSQPSVSYFERNLRNPNLTTLLRISDALGVNLGNLIHQAVKDIRGARS
jgi:transcriptional regulator with XRE-family HTH domain